MNPLITQLMKEFDEQWSDAADPTPNRKIRIKSWLTTTYTPRVLETERERIAEALKKLLPPKEFNINIHKIVKVIYLKSHE